MFTADFNTLDMFLLVFDVTDIQSVTAGLGALYGPLIIHTFSVSIHHTVANAF
jgi:hypothetical protein